jgi:hypothetical protein
MLRRLPSTRLYGMPVSGSLVKLENGPRVVHMLDGNRDPASASKCVV